MADALIASRCGTHSLGLVYEFLLKSYGNSKRARADFVRYLSGELSPGLLKEVHLWVSEEGGRPVLMDEEEIEAEFTAAPSYINHGALLQQHELSQANL